jgi:hypothetical protein
MSQKDVSYFRARSLQERIAARRAKCDSARRRHNELAAMYLVKVMMLSDPHGKFRTRACKPLSQPA